MKEKKKRRNSRTTTNIIIVLVHTYMQKNSKQTAAAATGSGVARKAAAKFLVRGIIPACKLSTERGDLCQNFTPFYIRVILITEFFGQVP